MIIEYNYRGWSIWCKKCRIIIINSIYCYPPIQTNILGLTPKLRSLDFFSSGPTVSKKVCHTPWDKNSGRRIFSFWPWTMPWRPDDLTNNPTQKLLLQRWIGPENITIFSFHLKLFNFFSRTDTCSPILIPTASFLCLFRYFHFAHMFSQRKMHSL